MKRLDKIYDFICFVVGPVVAVKFIAAIHVSEGGGFFIFQLRSLESLSVSG